MKIELNAQELEAAVIAHLSNSGLDLKKKTITFEFEGMCSIDIEAEDNTTPTAKKAPVKRAARKPKEVVKEEPAEETVAVAKPKKEAAKPKVEEVVEPEPTEEKVEKPSAAALFNTAPSEEDTSTNTDDGDNADEDTSLFG